jgi:preprotein translocase subunit SecE
MANREFRRRKEEEERYAEDLRDAEELGAGAPIKRERTPPKEYLEEVRGEVRKVAWPNRHEVANYTVVVLVATAFLMGAVFGMDYVFQAVVELIYGV